MDANRPSGARMSHGNPSDHAIHGRRRRPSLESALDAAREYLRTPCGGGPLARRDLEPNAFASIRHIRGSLLFFVSFGSFAAISFVAPCGYSGAQTQRKPRVAARSLAGAISRYLPC